MSAKMRKYTLPLVLLFSGVGGFVASLILTIDKFKTLQDPSYIPSCNINPIISCGSVMKTPQADVFGVANSLLGIAFFAALIMLAVSILAGGKYKRWFWLLVQGGMTFGLLFAHWLFYEALYSIGTLCPYCVGIWIVSILGFWYVTLFNLHEGNIPTPKRLRGIIGFIQRQHVDILILWYLIILGLVLHRFWYYFNPF